MFYYRISNCSFFHCLLLFYIIFKVRPKDSYSKIINIPPYSVWVENDNDSFTKSKDSRTFGALSKNLIIGQVDRIIWPPSRWSSVGNERPAIGRAWWP